MANKGSSVYTELFEQLPIPKRLEPQNIAAMLEASKLAGKTPVKVTPVEAKAPYEIENEAPSERKITVTGTKHRTSAVYRSIASVAACAALAFGVYSYANRGTGVVPDTQPNGGSYASDYNDVHKTFEKYYVGDSGNKTLDSAIKDIEHSYNMGEAPNSTQTSPDPASPAQPAVTDPAEPSTEPPVTEPVVTDPVVPEPAPADPEPPAETLDEKLPLPENAAEADNSDIAFGDGFLLRRDGNYLRIITTDNGNLNFVGSISPIYEENSTKTLAGFYTEGKKVVAIYSVVSGELVVTQPEEQTGDSIVGSIIDNLYGAPTAVVKERNSVEVCVYDLTNGVAALNSAVVLGGSLVDMNFVNGALYAVTSYDDYRSAPIIGVDDHESYVPSYTVNGEKFYVQAQDIMLPETVSTTDYAVISGITVDGRVSVKAVLGYEGRVVLKNGAVYLFGYDSVAGSELTSVRVFSLSGGDVLYAGFTDIDGVALSGDGISLFGDTIAISSIRKDIDGYTTTLGVYDGTMNSVSRVDIPAALTSAKRVGNKLYLSGSKGSYCVNLANPSIPEIVSDQPQKDAAEGLVAFDGGYVTLTKSGKGLILSKISKNESGALTLAVQTVVCSEAEIVSKALENNGRLFVSGNIVGVPYGYFDGYDYCYRFELYRLTDKGFEQAGAIESHELDSVYEPEKAIISGRVLYVFSDGRIYSTVIGDALAQISSADIIESAYSGH